MRAAVHHVGLGGGRSPFVAVMPIDRAQTPDVGPAGQGRWLRAPNAWLFETDVEPHARRAVHSPGIAHICVQARDGTVARPALEAAGVGFLSPPVALGTGFLYAYGFDADGRLIEMENAPFLAETPSGWIGHVALVTDDINRLAGFYGGLLDAEPERGAFRNNPLMKGVKVDSNLGRGNHAALMATPTLLFATGATDDSRPHLFAIDKKTGRRVGAVQTPAMGQYGLMTYLHQSKQYVILPVDGGYTGR